MLPTVLPLAALVVVAVVSYRRTGSASRALRITSLLDEPRTAGQLRVRALEPELVWLAHEHEPWQPGTV